ncbi:hypothetical protein PR048_003156 [Dryococelus australis]|uniref:Uncharacterized protein n=1 Tax=Dryococelus australis TaxID=614101 RepID=A0ABQ9IMB7_9NEOP|nr:hypothetical protein PR048_003156 [Dryococelus australis]
MRNAGSDAQQSRQRYGFTLHDCAEKSRRQRNLLPRWNPKAGETGATAGNLPTSGIIRNDSHVRKSGSDPARNRIRFVYVGGEQSDRYTTAAPLLLKYLLFHLALTVGCHDGPAERLVSCVLARRRLVARADSWESLSLVCSGGGGETVGGRKDTRRGAVSVGAE